MRYWLLIIALHLIPGVAFWSFFLLLTKLLPQPGGTTYLALILAIPLCLAPMLLGILIVWSKNKSGRASLAPALEYKIKFTLNDGLLIPLILFIAISALSVIFAPLVLASESYFSSWIPESTTTVYMLRELSALSPTLRLFTMISAVLFSGFVAPIVEEMYFRGFLLPKMASIGVFAPIVNAFLFGIYHFYFPWNVLPIFVYFTLVAWVVWKRQNLAVSITIHAVINLLGVMQVFSAI